VNTEELLKQRKEEGRNIAKMCRLIALEAGERYPKKHGANMVFSHNGLKLNQDTYADNLTVHYKGAWVLSVHLGSLTRYIPDEWTTSVKLLYAVLYAAKKALEEKKAIDKETERLAAFGIKKEAES
jgi:hypothetical protein